MDKRKDGALLQGQSGLCDVCREGQVRKRGTDKVRLAGRSLVRTDVYAITHIHILHLLIILLLLVVVLRHALLTHLPNRFHVDKLSSAHVYLRLRPGQTIDEVDDSIIMECAQLVKANSIEGCKLASTDVVYCMWSNLHKTADMVAGQIGYHDRAAVRKIKVVKDNSIVNRISKTKREEFPNLSEQQQQRLHEIMMEKKAREKAEKQAQKEKEKQDAIDREKQKELESFSSIFANAEMTSTADIAASVDNSAAESFEDDFM